MSVLKFNHLKTLRAARGVSQEELAAAVDELLDGASFSRNRLVRIEAQYSRANYEEGAALARALERMPVRATGKREKVTVDDLGLTLDRFGAKRGPRPRDVEPIAASG
jgi:hypothetical protein